MYSQTKVVTSFLWRFLERFGSQIISFAVSVILARKLGPGPAGQIAIVMAVVTILKVFADSGMANALIQKKDPDDLDFSSVFYFNFCFSLLLYLGLFLAAPRIAAAYRAQELTPVFRTLGLVLVISGLYNVQQAYVAKTLQFKRFFFATLGGILFSAVLSITMVYRGAGIWALVAQQLSNVAVNTAILWFTVGWRPKLLFSGKRLGGLLRYGWKLLVAQLLDTGYIQLYSLVIGKRYTAAQLGQVDKGRNWPDLITQSINASIDSVLFPVLSGVQDQRDLVRETTRRAIKVSSYIVMPMMAGLAACAVPLIRLLLKEQWLPCVPYMRIYCIIFAFYPLHTANLNAIKALGRSDLFLKLEIIKKAIETCVLLITLRISILAMLLGQLCCEFLAQIINAWPNGKLLRYPYLRQLRDMLPNIGLSLVMAGCVWLVSLLGLGDLPTLLLQVALGVSIYALGSRLLKLESFDYILGMVRKILQQKTETVS